MKRRLVATVLAVAAAATAGSIAWAAIPDSNSTIHVCYAAANVTRTGGAAVSIIDPERGGKCGRGQTELAFNQTGPAGPAGQQGPAGPSTPSTLYVLNSGAVTVGADLANTNGGTTARCRAGDVLQSGGFLRNQDVELHGTVVGSFPDDGLTGRPDGWTVTWMNGAPGEWFVAYAVCVDE